MNEIQEIPELVSSITQKDWARAFTLFSIKTQGLAPMPENVDQRVSFEYIVKMVF